MSFRPCPPWCFSRPIPSWTVSLSPRAWASWPWPASTSPFRLSTSCPVRPSCSPWAPPPCAPSPWGMGTMRKRKKSSPRRWWPSWPSPAVITVAVSLFSEPLAVLLGAGPQTGGLLRPVPAHGLPVLRLLHPLLLSGGHGEGGRRASAGHVRRGYQLSHQRGPGLPVYYGLPLGRLGRRAGHQGWPSWAV